MRSTTLGSVARAAATATLLLGLAAGSVAAHSQTVTPNGNGDGFTKGISNAWAQAHCNARSPEVLATIAVNAANSFSPAGNFACPTEPGENWPPGLQD